MMIYPISDIAIGLNGSDTNYSIHVGASGAQMQLDLLARPEGQLLLPLRFSAQAEGEIIGVAAQSDTGESPFFVLATRLNVSAREVWYRLDWSGISSGAKWILAVSGCWLTTPRGTQMAALTGEDRALVQSALGLLAKIERRDLGRIERPSTSGASNVIVFDPQDDDLTDALALVRQRMRAVIDL